MDCIKPGVAARLADGVYGIREQSNVARGMAIRGVKGLDDHFDLAKTKVASGISGAGVVSKESGFLMVAPGKGKLAGDYAVVVRGTASGVDWLSNLHAAVDRGPMGHSVHAGFNNVYKSIEAALTNELSGKNPSRIHCVGHSLGGAIANIAALTMAAGGHGVSLYTFGAPRVGLNAMTMELDREIGCENIYRVYNPADVVPLVPIHPFVHSPRKQQGLMVSRGSALFSIDAHFMDSYTPAVDHKSWDDFKSSRTTIPVHQRVDQLMDRADECVSIPGSSLGLWALGNALKGLIDLAMAVGGIVYAVGATVLDYIAQMLISAIALSKAVGERIIRWIGLVLKFAGKTTVKVGKTVTAVFLRWVLELMLQPLLLMARRAIHHGMR